MKPRITIIWPWNPNHARTRELFPIGPGFLAASLCASDYEVAVLDCALRDLRPDAQDFIDALRATEPDLVGVSWWTVNTPAVETTLRTICAALPDALTVVGGPHPSAFADLLVRHPLIDFAFYGEAERGIVQLAQCIERHGKHPPDAALRSVEGLAFVDSCGVVRKNEQSLPDQLDTIGAIDYRAMGLDAYYEQGYYYGGKLDKTPKKTAPIITTRGCPYDCTFCAAPAMNGRPLRRHSVEHVIRQVQHLYEDMGVRYLAIVDDNFTLAAWWAEKVCDAISSLGYTDLEIGTPNGIRMQKITPALARAMARAGWREVMVAPETGSPDTMKAMSKRLDFSCVPRVVKMFHDVGIRVTAFFIIGYPDETPADIELTEKFIYEHDFDFVGLSLFQPLPGTPMFDQLARDGRISPGFIGGHYQEVTFEPSGISKIALRDLFNRMWNSYRDARGLPSRNRAVATIREHEIYSQFVADVLAAPVHARHDGGRVQLRVHAG